MAVSPAIVQQYYTNVIRVAATPAQVAFYSNAADAATLLTTLENQATVQVNPIIRLYQGAFNRVPDPAGLNGWVAQYVNGPTGTGTATLSSIATGFVQSPEFASLYGPNPIATIQGQTAMVSNMYTNILNRQAGPVEVNLWLAEIARQQAQGYTNTQIATNVLLGFTNSPEFVQTSLPQIQAFQSASANLTETYSGSLWYQGAYTLTPEPDTATAATFLAPMAYTPGGDFLVNTLQSEDVLTGATGAGPTSLTATLGDSNNENWSYLVGPTVTNVQTVNVAFTNTKYDMTLDFQDIAGTNTANMTRINGNNRDSFINMHSDVTTLGISNTSETARATFTYLNNELSSAANAVTVNLNNVSLATDVYYMDGYVFGADAALVINATQARGSELQNQVEVFNLVTTGRASSIATFSTGVSSFDDLTVGERPQTVNIAAGADLSIGTLRWLGDRVETNSANNFQVDAAGGVNPFITSGHQVGLNGLGFVNPDQINLIRVAGASNVTLANVGTWETEVDANSAIDFTLNAALQTGDLTADISNAAASINAVVTGGLGSDRFYAASQDSWDYVPYTVSTSAGTETYYSYSFTRGQATVNAQISGGALVDTLTVQSNNGTTSFGVDLGVSTGIGGINLQAGSTGMEVLNLVEGMYSTGSVASWSVDLTDGGFSTLTFNNQDNTINPTAMSSTLTNMNGQLLSVRSTGLNSVGDLATTVQGATNIDFTQAASVTGGTINLELGHATDDRAVTDAFSWKNYSSNVAIIDDATGTNAAASLNLVVNSAGASGTGLAAITVDKGDFLTSTTVSSQVGATNQLNVGAVVYTSTGDANSSYYGAIGNNQLASATYNGSAYAGSQNVLFGAATQKSYTITTGSASDTVDLSYLVTSPAGTAAGYAISQNLLGTQINLGTGTEDELVLSASLYDPRTVLANGDVTYDGYFQNWSGIEELIINNRNAATLDSALQRGAAAAGLAYVALDAYAQTNNAGLSEIDFNDVNAELTLGFRFTNAMTVNVDATGSNTNANERATKTTYLNSLSMADLTVNVDTSDGIDNAGPTGNKVNFVSTGANLTNGVTLNYLNIDTSGATIGGSVLAVQNGGSLDVVNFVGDLGLSATTGAVAPGALTVTTDNTWTADGQTTVYDFRGVINSHGNADAVVTFDASAEGADADAVGLTIYGSNDGLTDATLVYGVHNHLTGSNDDDIIVSGGVHDNLVGLKGNDQITFNGTALSVSTVDISGGEGNDLITINAQAGDTANVVGGAGNDITNFGAETDRYSFADTSIAASPIGNTATVAQVQTNVGFDLINGWSGYNAATNTTGDKFQLDDVVFGINIGSAGALGATHFGLVRTLTDSTFNLTNEGVVVLQAVGSATADIYYVDQTVDQSTTTETLASLVTGTHATLIGTVTGISTGDLLIGQFEVV